MRVCDIHFTDRDRTGLNRICKDSIPSLHLPSQLVEGMVSEPVSTSMQQTQSFPLTLTDQSEGAVTLKQTQKAVLAEHNYCVTNCVRSESLINLFYFLKTSN
ncbi:uncharacterized protein LOC142983110 [Anticarsia gemmatalis]|uniref:uncharacterized protein LOC142983110 n=1 Tax=Anticarsia gemmatalis TaxID=129554 RepID=UPI003F7739F6